LLARMRASSKEILDGIRTQKALTPELEGKLKAVLDDFSKSFA
jgi:F-type H+-transporting ATPase subunit alpha